MSDSRKNALLKALPALLSLIIATSPAAAESAAGDFAPNLVEAFVGATFDDGDGELSLGGTYERRVNADFGIGGMAEYTDGREWVLAVPFFWHPAEPWRFEVAPGTEIEDGDAEFLVRVGGSYDIDFTGWSLSPELNLDFVDGDVKVVVGVSFGWDFP
jgi:hypothetical protein